MGGNEAGRPGRNGNKQVDDAATIENLASICCGAHVAAFPNGSRDICFIEQSQSRCLDWFLDDGLDILHRGLPDRHLA